MTNEEMPKAMEFIVEAQKRSPIKPESLAKPLAGKRSAPTRSDKRWKRTEERLRALLAKARSNERKMAVKLRMISPPDNTAVDKPLKSLTKLVERQTSEDRKGKRRKP